MMLTMQQHQEHSMHIFSAWQDRCTYKFPGELHRLLILHYSREALFNAEEVHKRRKGVISAVICSASKRGSNIITVCSGLSVISCGKISSNKVTLILFGVEMQIESIFQAKNREKFLRTREYMAGNNSPINNTLRHILVSEFTSNVFLMGYCRPHDYRDKPSSLETVIYAWLF